MTSLLRNSNLFRKLSIVILTATVTARSFAGGYDDPKGVTIPTSPAVATTAPSQAGSELTTQGVYTSTLKAVALIQNNDNDSIGTGWIVDADRRLIVTNQHVISEASEVELIFPIYENGVLQSDVSKYRQVRTIRGTVIDSVTYADLAIVQADSLPSDVRELTLANSSATPGERVHAVGGMPKGSFGLWKYSNGFVSLVSATSAVTGTNLRVMQSNIDINPGNSGGPIVNDRGELVGVAQSIHTQANDVAYNVDVTEVARYLDKVMPLIDNSTPEALLELGRRNRQASRPQTALTYLSQALRANPNLVEAQVERGWAFRDMGDSVTAINDFTAAINKNPNLAAAYKGRGKIYYGMDEYAKAISDFSMAIANDPTNADHYNDRALAQEMSEHHNLAIADYSQAIRMEGDNHVFLTNRGDLYSKMNEYRKAVKDFDRALVIAPNYAWANNEMGLALHALKEYKLARPYLLKACELKPDYAKYIRDFGETLQSLGEHEVAVKAWSLAIEKKGDHAYSYYSRAWSLHKLNNNRAAAEDMMTAIKLDNDNATYFAFRGKLHKALGNNNASQADYARAAQLDPERFADNDNNNSTRNASTTANPLEGRWYVNTTVNGTHVEMTQVFYADGRYECQLTTKKDNDIKQLSETGRYRLAGNQIEFDTNVGKYTMDCKMENGMFWLLFNDLGSWVGSVRR